ncbi:MAG: transcription factor IIA subunit alpha [Caeruleum heppii]|nr:MAG: transcription factor IIA subunit alpha [Caeruleum heppii]
MSNQLVGSIYHRIINEVIDSSQIDFEEGGVDQGTLDELRQVWQRKLSALQVAQFPWDPAPVTQPIANPPTVPSNASLPRPAPAGSSATTPSLASPAAPSDNAGAIKIKTEPDFDNGAPSPTFPVPPPTQPTSTPLNNPQAAAQRAANLMHQKFGSQANNSIGAIQSGLTMPGARPAMPGVGNSHNGSAQPYAQTQSPPQQQQQRNGVDTQTDGADDAWNAVLVQRDRQGGNAELARVEIDHMIRDQVEEMGRRMEGGGLMVPLDERTSLQKSKKRKAAALAGLSHTHPSWSADTSNSATEAPQLDGNLDDSDSDTKENVHLGPDIKDDPDEDAINSDLDDPDDNLGRDEEDDAAMTQVMLCMYDKVQRVKNKWKCTLKDGVLTVNGKE